MMMGLNVIDPGHNVEKIMKQGVTQYLTIKCLEKGFRCVDFSIAGKNRAI